MLCKKSKKYVPVRMSFFSLSLSFSLRHGDVPHTKTSRVEFRPGGTRRVRVALASRCFGGPRRWWDPRPGTVPCLRRRSAPEGPIEKCLGDDVGRRGTD